MADWVHCNTCFRQPTGDGRQFSLTNCGHIYCEGCVRPGSQLTCKMCKTKCTTILLSPKMKPDVELFFTDPTELAKKQNKQLLQVIEFQKNHRQRLTAWIREKTSKQSNIVATAQKSLQQIHDYEKDIKLLKEENCYLKKLVEKQTAGGPGRTSPMAGMRNGGPGGSPSSGQKPRTSPTNYDISPRSQAKRPFISHVNSVPQMTKSPYDLPVVTTGRVLVKTPPNHFQMSSMIPRTPSPYIGMNAQVPPHMKMPITPVSHGHALTPMDISRTKSPIDHARTSSPQVTPIGKTVYSGPGFPSRLR